MSRPRRLHRAWFRSATFYQSLLPLCELTKLYPVPFVPQRHLCVAIHYNVDSRQSSTCVTVSLSRLFFRMSMNEKAEHLLWNLLWVLWMVEI